MPRAGVTLVLLLCSAASLRAQEPAAATFGEPVDVRVVNVEATVTDATGRPVHGLTAKDFRLLVDGQEVAIDHFDEVVDGRAAPSAAPVAAPEASGDDEALARTYLVLIDDSFAVPGPRNKALAALGRELSVLNARDRMAIVAFDGRRLDTLSPWTDDHAAVAAALAAAARRPAGGGRLLAENRAMAEEVDFAVEAAIETGLDADEIGVVTDALNRRVNPAARTQLGRTTTALAGALRSFDAPAGRKVLVLLAGGWSVGVAPPLFGPFIEAANRLGYTVYPVDVATSEPELGSALEPLARATGGRVAPKLATVLASVAADSGTYYWLGFDARFHGDDKVHRIEVSSRRPDLTVRSRNSYSDLSPRTEVTMKAEGVLLFGGAPEDRRLVVEAAAPRRVSGSRREVELNVTLGVPVNALAFTRALQGTGYLAEIPLAISALDSRGGRSDLPSSRLRVTLEQPPPAGGLARFRTAVRVRRVSQRLVFTVMTADGSFLWGETQLTF